MGQVKVEMLISPGTKAVSLTWRTSQENWTGNLTPPEAVLTGGLITSCLGLRTDTITEVQFRMSASHFITRRKEADSPDVSTSTDQEESDNFKREMKKIVDLNTLPHLMTTVNMLTDAQQHCQLCKNCQL